MTIANSQEDAQLEEKLREGFKYFNHFMLLMWRLGLGPWLNFWDRTPERYMVITHIGRKSGKRRQTVVNYADFEGELYCTAGFGAKADWYQNLMANPHVEVWLTEGWWAGVADEVIDSQARLPILRQIIINSGFAGRMAGLDPYGMPDAELDRLTKTYRLIHIHRTIARTGRDGPGELSWIWPIATFLLLPLVIFGRRRRK